MEEEIREVLAENEAKRGIPKDVNMFDYVTITLAHYEELIRPDERCKVAQEMQEKLNSANGIKEYYSKKCDELREELAQAKEVIKQYKADYEKKLGISELQKVKEVQDADA